MILWLVFSVNITFSQTSKTIIIDTLHGYTRNLEKKVALYSLCFKTSEDIIDDDKSVVSIDFNRIPNVVIENITRNDLCMLLDDKGGQLRLNNINNVVSDTIRISQWFIYNNGLTDTSKSVKFVHHMYNDSLVKPPCNIDKTVKIKKNKGKENLKSIRLVINNRNYIVPITKNSSISTANFHGYKPKRKYRKYLSKSDSDKVYNFKYFHGETKKILKVFSGELSF